MLVQALPTFIFSLCVGDVDMGGILEVVLVHPHGRMEEEMTILYEVSLVHMDRRRLYHQVKKS